MPRSPTEILDDMKSVVSMLETRTNLSNLLSRVRMIHESDEQTLDRILRERAAVVRVLHADPAAARHHEEFDFDYRSNFFEVVERYLKPALLRNKE